MYTVIWSLPAFNLQLYKRGYLPYRCPDNGLKGTVVKRHMPLHKLMSFKITPTVLLSKSKVTSYSPVK